MKAMIHLNGDDSKSTLKEEIIHFSINGSPFNSNQYFNWPEMPADNIREEKYTKGFIYYLRKCFKSD